MNKHGITLAVVASLIPAFGLAAGILIDLGFRGTAGACVILAVVSIFATACVANGCLKTSGSES